MRNGVRNLITDVPGLRVGNAQDAALRSGSTVLLADRPFVAAVSLMGGAFQARSADEGRSAFSKAGGGTRLGEKIVDERVTLLTDPAVGFVKGYYRRPLHGEGLEARPQRVDLGHVVAILRRNRISTGVRSVCARTRRRARATGGRSPRAAGRPASA